MMTYKSFKFFEMTPTSKSRITPSPKATMKAITITPSRSRLLRIALIAPSMASSAVPARSAISTVHSTRGLQRRQRPGLLRNAASRGGGSGHLAVFSPHITQYIGFIHGLAGAYRWGWRDRWRGWRAGAAAENRYAQCQRKG